MSMVHKAFVFDYEAFHAELAPILAEAMDMRKVDELAAFIDDNLASLWDLENDTRLDKSWRIQLTETSVDELGDLALTKYYNPIELVGLEYDWRRLWKLLEPLKLGNLIFGKMFTTKYSGFDPGQMGTYFQSPEQVKENLTTTQSLLSQYPEYKKELDLTIKMLSKAAVENKGLFIWI
jgi:hypothetical protein